MTVPFTHVTHTTVDYPCQTGSHPLETLSLISAGGDRWVELAGGGGGGLSCNEGRLGSDISATCIWAYPQYQRGRLESDIQARTKEAATHWSAGDSPDGNLLFSHEGWVGPYTDFELGWRQGRVLLTPGSMDFTHTAPPSQGTGEWHDMCERFLGHPRKNITPESVLTGRLTATTNKSSTFHVAYECCNKINFKRSQHVL